MINYFNKNKVFIMGMLLSVALVVSQLISSGEVSNQVIVEASVTALLSFLARNLRGQWTTIMGFLATNATTYFALFDSGHVEWKQVIAQVCFMFIAIATPPAKSIGYEQTDIIKLALKKGEQNKPTLAKPKPDKA